MILLVGSNIPCPNENMAMVLQNNNKTTETFPFVHRTCTNTYCWFSSLVSLISYLKSVFDLKFAVKKSSDTFFLERFQKCFPDLSITRVMEDNKQPSVALPISSKAFRLKFSGLARCSAHGDPSIHPCESCLIQNRNVTNGTALQKTPTKQQRQLTKTNRSSVEHYSQSSHDQQLFREMSCSFTSDNELY